MTEEPTPEQMREIVEQIPGARSFDIDGVAWGRFNDRSRETLVSMSPGAFLAMASPMQAAPWDPPGTPAYSLEKMATVVEVLERGGRFYDLPYLVLGPADEDGVAKVTGHEGRHRAMALREIGVEEIPVVLTSRDHRWGSPPGPWNGARPRRLEGEDGWRFEERGGSLREVRDPRDNRMDAPVSLFYGSEEPEVRSNGGGAGPDLGDKLAIVRWLVARQAEDYRAEQERWGDESAASYLDPERGHYTPDEIAKGARVQTQHGRLLRLLRELADAGFVVRVEAARRVGVGPRVMHMVRRKLGLPGGDA